MRVALFFLTLLFSFAVVHAQDALTPKQAKAKYDKADKALNEAWAAAKAALPESEFNKLKEDQRGWVEHRDYLARSPQYSGADGQGELALNSPDYLSAAAELEDTRTEWLKALVRAHKQPGGDLTGVWTDSYGGTLQVVEREGKLYFVMECVRGPTFHVGGISGVGDWNQTIGWFSDAKREAGRDDITNLSFIMRRSQLEVTGANTGPYHGARAYFDGLYVKTGTLDAKAQARVIKAAKDGQLLEG